MEKLDLFTKEQEQRMKLNGIPREIARSRVRRMGWPAEKAVTTPVQKRVNDLPKPLTHPKVAYMRFMEERKDKSHLSNYPQSVKASDYYKYLESKVLWDEI